MRASDREIDTHNRNGFVAQATNTVLVYLKYSHCYIMSNIVIRYENVASDAVLIILPQKPVLQDAIGSEKIGE